MFKKVIISNVALLFCVLVLAGCGQVSAPHLKPLPAEVRALLAKKQMRQDSPIFLRIFKQESELEVWKVKADGRYHHFKTYPICNWSGKIGPKQRQGDKQSPEGFYRVSQLGMNPNSKYHLSFNLGYPNAYDRSRGRTGKHLMVHGDCKSVGCYAMTDALVEEIYLLARESFRGGQEDFSVHAFPFRMTNANLKKHRRSKWYPFWKDLKQGYDHFEAQRTEPKVNVCSKRYLINASFIGGNGRIDPKRPCPSYQKFVPGLDLKGSRFVVAKAATRSIATPARAKVQTVNRAAYTSADETSSAMFGQSMGYGFSMVPKTKMEQIVTGSMSLSASQ